MRQLVSVVTDQSVAYFLADETGEHLQQIAQVMNPGLQVPAVVSLGANLTDALGLNGRANGHRPSKAIPAPEAPTEEPPPRPRAPHGLTKSGKPRKRAAPTQPRRNWNLSMDDVLADLIEHPESTRAESALRLTGDSDHAAQQVVGNHLLRLYQAGEVRRGERDGTTTHGARRTLTTYSANLPAAGPLPIPGPIA